MSEQIDNPFSPGTAFLWLYPVQDVFIVLAVNKSSDTEVIVEMLCENEIIEYTLRSLKDYLDEEMIKFVCTP